MTGRSHWTERGDDNIFYVWPLWCACSFSGCKWAYCHGTLLCEFSIPKCGGVLGGNDQNRAEKQNVVLTWFRPVTRSSGHLGRRKVASGNLADDFGNLGKEYSWKHFDAVICTEMNFPAIWALQAQRKKK